MKHLESYRTRIAFTGSLLASSLLVLGVSDFEVPGGDTSEPARSVVLGASPTPEGNACNVESINHESLPLPYEDLDEFYKKICWTMGVPVVGSEAIADEALIEAANEVRGMLEPYPEYAERLSVNKIRIGLIDTDQLATAMPEYRDLPEAYPDMDWDSARAYGATTERPLLALPEEHFAPTRCNGQDTYPGQRVLTHELGHTILNVVISPRDSGKTVQAIHSAYEAALQNPVYANSYAIGDANEYWAEGVQDFFDASKFGSGPDGGGDGYDSPIHDFASLRELDPRLHEIISRVFYGERTWVPRRECATGTQADTFANSPNQ